MRILLADDHKIMCDGLSSLLKKEPGMEVIAEAQDGPTAVKLAAELSPDVIIMDIAMPDLNGIEATRRITGENPNIKVVALSMHSDRRFVVEMLKAGALGYVFKDCAFEELVDAVNAVAINQYYFSPFITGFMIKDYIQKLKNEDTSVFASLTAREREVLQIVAEGKTTTAIASALNLSEKTVETHRRQIMNKLGIYSVAGLTKYAIREGLTSVES